MSSSRTSLDDPFENGKLTRLRRSVATLVIEAVTAATLGAQKCFLSTAGTGTSIVEDVAESSTSIKKARPDVEARLQAMLDDARRDIIEDGMQNAVTEQLADLALRNFDAVLPWITSTIVGGGAPSDVVAEMLKELGRMRDVTSHGSRRWLLERALLAPSPFVRDGAGLGLARMADPAALHSLRNAIKLESNPETRSDLQLVVDELSEMVR